MGKAGFGGPLEQIDECSWRIPPDYKLGMQVEGQIFADERLIDQIRSDQAPEQVAQPLCSRVQGLGGRECLRCG